MAATLTRASARRCGGIALALAVGFGMFGLAACSEEDEDEPAAPTLDADAPPPSTIPVRLTDTGCEPADFQLAPGIVVFSVSNPDGASVQEMEIQDANGKLRGDVEGVTAGVTRSLIIELATGTYRVRCPEDAPDGGTITVG